MNIFKNLKGHFCTITHHKMLVMKTCFKVEMCIRDRNPGETNLILKEYF